MLVPTGNEMDLDSGPLLHTHRGLISEYTRKSYFINEGDNEQ